MPGEVVFDNLIVQLMCHERARRGQPPAEFVPPCHWLPTYRHSSKVEEGLTPQHILDARKKARLEARLQREIDEVEKPKRWDNGTLFEKN